MAVPAGPPLRYYPLARQALRGGRRFPRPLIAKRSVYGQSQDGRPTANLFLHPPSTAEYQKQGESILMDPDPNPVEVFCFYEHPSVPNSLIVSYDLRSSGPHRFLP
jgi:hypothetical protein